MLMASSSKALGKTTGCVQKNKVPCNKSRKTNAQEQRKIKKERACSPKLRAYRYPHRFWLQIHWAVKLLFIQTHPVGAAHCCGSATVPNSTESNDFLITLWQQYGPWHGWWQSCNWYSAHPLSSQACYRARQTKATHNKTLLLPAAAFVCSQLCFRAWDITLLVTHTGLHRKSPKKFVIFK